MKRILAFVATFMLCCVALAEIDLSGLSIEELAALRDQCQCEIFQREDWQEVTVPQGIWEVGKDIPAGTWTVKCSDAYSSNAGMRVTYISIGDKLNSTKTELDYVGMTAQVMVYNPNNDYYTGGITEFTFTVEDGFYIYIDYSYNQAVFTPYTGKPSLGFK